MALSRREFFKQVGSRDTLRKLAGFVSQGLGDLLGTGENAGGSVEEAGRALRNMGRNRSRKLRRNLRSTCEGAGNAPLGDAALTARNSPLDEVNSHAGESAETEDSLPVDSDEPQAPP